MSENNLMMGPIIFTPTNIITIKKIKKQMWAEHVEHIGPIFNVYKTYAGKLKWKRTLERFIDVDDRKMLNCVLDKCET
jgi:hypothetical protein